MLHVTKQNQLYFEEAAVAEFMTALLRAAGAPAAHAAAVAGHLVESSRQGLHSHGVVRLSQYVDEIRSGELDPAASAILERRDGARVSIDGRRAFGQVAAEFAVACAIEVVAEHAVAFVTVRRAGHAGRIGAYTESLARAGYVGLAFCSGPRSGHRVAPFGGRAGRIATNPLSYAVPAEDGPIVADFATSTATEGQIRLLRERGVEAAPGTLLDSAGRPTLDPNVLYQDPPGTVVPLGGELFGHKGFALGLLVDVVATLLAGDDADDADRFGNNLALLALATEAGLPARAQRFAAYVRSSPPVDAERPVQMPGDRERDHRRRSAGVLVDKSTWDSISVLAAELSIPLPTPSATAPEGD